ncbi:polyprenyl synthetase family protein [Streptomyces sp. NPDC052101]|uniref:polyprenyl synthetase family protein n=1 Tax=Streptomyces sp. NPDC052101 TaxID=3155763 RepID=UPI00343CF90E
MRPRESKRSPAIRTGQAESCCGGCFFFTAPAPWEATSPRSRLLRRLECAHVGSLLHDDLIDGDDVRRGRPAAHRRFGPAAAIVTGNALFFTWFEAPAVSVQRGVPHRRIVSAMRIQAEAGRQVWRARLGRSRWKATCRLR